MRADVAGIEDRDAERRGRRTTRWSCVPKPWVTLASLFSRMARRYSHASVGAREAACPGGDAVCGCESLISKWLCERSRFRTVLKSGSGLSVVALWAGALQRSARIVPLAEGVQ
jgi:hypothetical protein